MAVILKLGFFVSPIKKSQPWLSNAVHECVWYVLYCLAWACGFIFFKILRIFSLCSFFKPMTGRSCAGGRPVWPKN